MSEWTRPHFGLPNYVLLFSEEAERLDAEVRALVKFMRPIYCKVVTLTDPINHRVLLKRWRWPLCSKYQLDRVYGIGVAWEGGAGWLWLSAPK